METLVLIGQTVLIALMAGWLALGAIENIRTPRVNGDVVVEVFTMQRIRQYPEIFAAVSKNRIDNPTVHRLLFACIVVAESVVAIILTVAAAALCLALPGILEAELARMIAVVGVIGFIMIWGGFLVGGQWFHYWAGHEWAQATHFALLLWGLGTLIFLT